MITSAMMLLLAMAANPQADATLFEATVRMDLAGVRRALDDGANPNRINGEGSPLHVASYYGAHDIVELLLKRGANPNLILAGATPLEVALINSDRNYDSIAALAKAGADLLRAPELFNSSNIMQSAFSRDDFRLPRLIMKEALAARARNPEPYDELMERLREIQWRMDAQGKMGNSSADRQGAPTENFHKFIGQSLASIDSIQAGSKGDRLAFQLAISRGDVRHVRRWLANKANPDMEMELYGAPIILAVEAGQHEILELLIQAGASLDIKSGPLKATPLQLAMRRGDVTAIKILSQAGAHGEDMEKDFATVDIDTAVMHGYLAVVAWKLRQGDPAAALGAKRLLFAALQAGHIRVAELILNKWPKEMPGETAPVVCGALYNVKSLEFILEKGYKPDSCGDEPPTLLTLISPIRHAMYCKYKDKPLPECNYIYLGPIAGVDRLKLLLDHGANPNAATSNGWTALWAAAKSGNEEAVKLLLERGANPNLANVKGETPLFAMAAMEAPAPPDFLPAHEREIWAEQNMRALRIAKMMIDEGADVNQVTYYGSSALQEAARAGGLRTAETILQTGIEPYAEAFEAAAKSGHPEILALLARLGDPPSGLALVAAVELTKDDKPSSLQRRQNHSMYINQQALQWISSRFNSSVLFLIKRCANNEGCASQNREIFKLASSSGMLELAEEMIKMKLPEQDNLDAALANAVWGGRRYLWNDYYFIGAPFVNQNKRVAEYVDALVKGGADINLRDTYGRTPLITSAAQGGGSILLGQRGKPVRYEAPWKQELEIRGKINSRKGEGMIIPGLAQEFRNESPAPSVIDVTPPENYNPADRAIVPDFNQGPMLEVLLKAGAEVNAMDRDRKTALDYLMESRELSSLLRSYGAKTGEELGFPAKR
ncbi:MAG: ankyrin repeat domain-containing protein [Nitrospinota bacterium]|nr:ankyrin repeat domain-containing protein [Nitrospinota bacterium]